MSLIVCYLMKIYIGCRQFAVEVSPEILSVY